METFRNIGLVRSLVGLWRAVVAPEVEPDLPAESSARLDKRVAEGTEF
ncbi:hypothetical protein [Thermus thermophilus]